MCTGNTCNFVVIYRRFVFIFQKKNIRSGSRYKQYNAYSIECGCDAVIHGGLSVLRASKVYGVPENTLRGFVKERRAKMAEGSEEIDSHILGAGQDCVEDNISEIMDKYLENEACLVSKDSN